MSVRYEKTWSPSDPWPYFDMTSPIVLDDNFPDLINPPNGPLLTSWGSYDTLLEGGRVFVYRINVATKQVETLDMN